MARIVWAESALRDLDGIADFIALDEPAAAKRLIKRAFAKVDQLVDLPESGTSPRDLRGTPYRRLIVKPILIYYRIDGSTVYMVHVARGKRQFNLQRIRGHDK